MENLYEVKETISRAIDESDTVKSGELKMGELEFLNLATNTIKNINKICMLEEEGGYSSAVDGMDYGRGSSYANRGKHYVQGHYSRDGGMDRGGYSSRRDSRGRYSRDDGRSEMMEHIEMAIDSADERDREKIKRFMRELENA